MTTKKRDDELLVWVIVGVIFTGVLMYIDFSYSSVNVMAPIARGFIWFGHGLLSLGWVISIAFWKDPLYDVIRKGVVLLCIILGLIIGIHHSSVVEDNQVLIDSRENAEKK